LDAREEDIPCNRVGGDDGRSEVHGARDEAGLTLAGGSDDLLSEPAREHERLGLEDAVEEPQHAKGDLEVASGERPA
jgi:hypothetical protein